MLWHAQVYRQGTHDRSLKREPVKESTQPGGKKTYDSVQVCVCVHVHIVCARVCVHISYYISGRRLLAFKLQMHTPAALLQGNISGHNEYVVYNAYRVLPEYIIEYKK